MVKAKNEIDNLREGWKVRQISARIQEEVTQLKSNIDEEIKKSQGKTQQELDQIKKSGQEYSDATKTLTGYRPSPAFLDIGSNDGPSPSRSGTANLSTLRLADSPLVVDDKKAIMSFSPVTRRNLLLYETRLYSIAHYAYSKSYK